MMKIQHIASIAILPLLILQTAIAFVPFRPDITTVGWRPTTVKWYFSTSNIFPNDTYRTRVQTAASTWNRISSSTFRYIQLSTPSNEENTGSISFRALTLDEGGILASGIAKWSVYSGDINPPTIFNISMNADYEPANLFYTGTSKPPVNQYDFLSSITHELGHAAGLGHTDKPCEDLITSKPLSNAPTMCFSSKPQEIYKRSLASDDIAGMQFFYR